MAVSEARIGKKPRRFGSGGGRVRRSRWAVYDWVADGALLLVLVPGAAWIAATFLGHGTRAPSPTTSCRSRSRMDTVPARPTCPVAGRGLDLVRSRASCREKRSRPAPPPATRPRHSLQGSGGGGRPSSPTWRAPRVRCGERPLGGYRPRRSPARLVRGQFEGPGSIVPFLRLLGLP